MHALHPKRIKKCLESKNQAKQERPEMVVTPKSEKRRSKNLLSSELLQVPILTMTSLFIPTTLMTIFYYGMYGLWPWSDQVVYAQSGNLFDFYILCSISYLVSTLVAWCGGITNTTKIICTVMFIMVVDNICMAIDSQRVISWELLEVVDDCLQLICSVVFGLVLLVCLIMKLLRSVCR